MTRNTEEGTSASESSPLGREDTGGTREAKSVSNIPRFVFKGEA